MKNYKQPDRTKETEDCLRACVATILGMKMKDVPNFALEGPEPNEVKFGKRIYNLEQWLDKMGLGLIGVTGAGSHELRGTPNVYGIGAVMSLTHEYGKHAIVFRFNRHGNKEVWWDPNPDLVTCYPRFQLFNALHLFFIVPKPGCYK